MCTMDTTLSPYTGRIDQWPGLQTATCGETPTQDARLDLDRTCCLSTHMISGKRSEFFRGAGMRYRGRGVWQVCGRVKAGQHKLPAQSPARGHICQCSCSSCSPRLPGLPSPRTPSPVCSMCSHVSPVCQPPVACQVANHPVVRIRDETSTTRSLGCSSPISA